MFIKTNVFSRIKHKIQLTIFPVNVYGNVCSKKIANSFGGGTVIQYNYLTILLN
jgi:hypothetical protein